MKRITKKLLQAKGACAEQVALFDRLWPKGVVPSLKALQRADREGLDLTWFVDHTLSPANWLVFTRDLEAAFSQYETACRVDGKEAFHAVLVAAINEYSASRIKAILKAMQRENNA